VAANDQRTKANQPELHPGISASEFYHDKPSVNICTWLPPAAGFTKIVSFAAPRLRFMIEDCD
jgi:hypothetical protein